MYIRIVATLLLLAACVASQDSWAAENSVDCSSLLATRQDNGGDECRDNKCRARTDCRDNKCLISCNGRYQVSLRLYLWLIINILTQATIFCPQVHSDFSSSNIEGRVTCEKIRVKKMQSQGNIANLCSAGVSYKI